MYIEDIRFILRAIDFKDAKDLLEVYSNMKSVALFNSDSDNC